MELDELKQQLQQKMNEASVDNTDVNWAAMLHKKTNSVLQKLKNSLQLEVWLCVACTLLFIAIATFSQHKSFRIYFGVFAVFCAMFLVVLLLLLKRVQQNNSQHLSVKENLTAIHSILKEYTKRNFQLTMALIPVCLLFAGYLGYQEGKAENLSDDLDKFHSFYTSSKTNTLLLIIYVVTLTLGAYYFTKWYLKKLYGNYLLQLQDCINELQ